VYRLLIRVELIDRSVLREREIFPEFDPVMCSTSHYIVQFTELDPIQTVVWVWERGNGNWKGMRMNDESLNRGESIPESNLRFLLNFALGLVEVPELGKWLRSSKNNSFKLKTGSDNFWRIISG
jgi:hypothetical protein